MRQIVDHREVMRDEQVGQPEVVLQCLEQIENLRLDRDVKRRGRLVANDQLRLDGQCTRNGYALPLAGSRMVPLFCGARTSTMKSMMWRGVRNWPASPWLPRTLSQQSACHQANFAKAPDATVIGAVSHGRRW